MATFILIHGAWHGAWCWELVTPLLQELGHRSLTPDMPGMGDGRAHPHGDVLGMRARAVAELVAAQTSPVVLVGHSRGGVVVSSVAEALPDRVGLAIYVAAFLLADGQNQADADIAVDEDLAAALRVDPTSDGLVIDGGRALPMFYGMADPSVARSAAARLRTDSASFAGDRVRLTQARYGRVPRAYVETARDRAIPIADQRRMQDNWPCEPIVTLESDHSPFYSMPEQFARTLHEIAAGRDL